MLIDEYRHWLERRELRPNTIKSYVFKAEGFISWTKQQGIDIAEATDETVFKFVEHLTITRRQGPNTRRTHIFALRNYMDYLVERGVFTKNPARDVVLPKRAETPPHSLSEEDIAKIMHAAFENKSETGMRDLAIISVLAGTGCRVSAIGMFRLNDFRPSDMLVPERCQHCGQYLLTGRFAGRGKKIKATIARLHEKGGKTWEIPLPEKAAAYLSIYLTHRKRFFGTDIVFPIFRDQQVRPIGRHGVLDMLVKYAKQAGVTVKVHPHMFRHASITWLLDYGVDVETVQRWHGHAAVQQTMAYRHKSMRSYVHSGISTDRNILEHIPTPMDVLFNRGKG